MKSQMDVITGLAYRVSWIENVDFEAQLYSDPIYIYVTHSRMFKPTQRYKILLSWYKTLALFLKDSLQVPGLGQYRWSKRVIVTYSQSEEHPEVVRLKTEISQRACDYNNRNLVHEHVNTGASRDDFKIVLIGYDGGVKYTAYESSLQTIFDIIDLMPMRMRERRYDVPC